MSDKLLAHLSENLGREGNDLCYVCRQKVTGEKVLLDSATTLYSGQRLTVKISELICLIIIGEHDIICHPCIALFNHLDKLENEMEVVKMVLMNHLERQRLPTERSATNHSERQLLPKRNLRPAIGNAQQNAAGEFEQGCVVDHIEAEYHVHPYGFEGQVESQDYAIVVEDYAPNMMVDDYSPNPSILNVLQAVATIHQRRLVETNPDNESVEATAANSGTNRKSSTSTCNGESTGLSSTSIKDERAAGLPLTSSEDKETTSSNRKSMDDGAGVIKLLSTSAGDRRATGLVSTSLKDEEATGLLSNLVKNGAATGSSKKSKDNEGPTQSMPTSENDKGTLRLPSNSVTNERAPELMSTSVIYRGVTGLLTKSMNSSGGSIESTDAAEDRATESADTKSCEIIEVLTQEVGDRATGSSTAAIEDGEPGSATSIMPKTESSTVAAVDDEPTGANQPPTVIVQNPSVICIANSPSTRNVAAEDHGIRMSELSSVANKAQKRRSPTMEEEQTNIKKPNRS